MSKNIYNECKALDTDFPGLKDVELTFEYDGEYIDTPWNKGKKGVQEGYWKGKKMAPFSEKRKRNIAKAMSQKWNITTPNGKILKIYNLKKFCRDNNLNQGAMYYVSIGRYKQHKGYTCTKMMQK